MAEIQKGVVTTVEENRARVMSALKEGDVTRPLKLASGIDGKTLQKGSKVAYVIFEDMTGVILAEV